jgi:hypothetical protein
VFWRREKYLTPCCNLNPEPKYMDISGHKQNQWPITACISHYHNLCRSQWLRGLRRGSTAARLLRLRFQIPPRAWMSVCCECCVLSGRGLCVGLVNCPEESYRVCCVWVWSWNFEKWGGLGPQGAVEP